jgi:hypothetical protein
VNINLTLVVQMVIFVILIWFTMKFVWPMITRSMRRHTRISSANSPPRYESFAGYSSGALRAAMGHRSSGAGSG